MSQNIVECPTCEDQLPVVSFNACGPELKDDGLVGILLARPDQPFANIEDPAEHTARTSNSSVDANAVRRLTGVGSFSTEFGEAMPIGRLTYYGKQTATLELDVYDNNDINYHFIQLLGCNSSYAVWLIDANGYVYGGNEGYKMVLQGRENIANDFEAKRPLQIRGEVKFTSPKDRTPYPLMAELDGLI